MILTFIVYLLLVIFIAIFFSRDKNRTASEYYTGDREFGSFITAVSTGATDSSGWIFIGAVGTVYATGISLMWIAVGAGCAHVINWFLIGPSINKYAIKTKSLSLIDVFENKVKSKNGLTPITKAIRICAGIVILVFFIPFMAAQLMSIGAVVEVIFDFNYTWGMILGSIFVLGYVIFGGYKSVMLTDFIQGLIMFSVLIIFPLFAIMYSGGFRLFFEKIMSIDPILLSATAGLQGKDAFALIAGYLVLGCGVFGQPHVTQRFITARNPETVLNGSTVGIIWIVFTISGATLIGLVARVYVPLITNPEYAFPELASSVLPPVLLGIVTAAIFAAIQSTLSSQLMVTTQSFVTDTLSTIFKGEIPVNRIVTVSRIVMVLLLVITILIASVNFVSVFGLINYAWAGVASSFGPLSILVLTTKKVTKLGALLGIITGTATTIVWANLGLSSLTFVIVPAVIAATIMILIGSWFERKLIEKNMDL